MSAREDFISLFKGYESEIEKLHTTHFHVKDFSYMITSQRTTRQIYNKLRKAINNDTEYVHHNFWADLSRLGLADSIQEKVTLFGRAVYDYFQSEIDDFKREHFIFNGIRQNAFDITIDVYDEYNNLLNNLYDCLEIIPEVNFLGNELIRNPEKLLITAFLNKFPYALTRYYDLPTDRQEQIDLLREVGLKALFQSLQTNEEVYYKIARRLWNMWRALDRRVNFVKSAILSYYEEMCIFQRKKVPLDVNGKFKKLLNINLLTEIILQSDKIEIINPDEEVKFIDLITEFRQTIPSSRNIKRRQLVRKRRQTSRKAITNLEALTQRQTSDYKKLKHGIDPMKLALEIEIKRERTKKHQEIVRKFCEIYLAHNIIPDENNFDLLVEKNDFVLLHEMKTLTKDNERTQIMKAVGQLFYYEFYDLPDIVDIENKKVIKILALKKKII